MESRGTYKRLKPRMGRQMLVLIISLVIMALVSGSVFMGAYSAYVSDELYLERQSQLDEVTAQFFSTLETVAQAQWLNVDVYINDIEDENFTSLPEVLDYMKRQLGIGSLTNRSMEFIVLDENGSCRTSNGSVTDVSQELMSNVGAEQFCFTSQAADGTMYMNFVNRLPTPMRVASDEGVVTLSYYGLREDMARLLPYLKCDAYDGKNSVYILDKDGRKLFEDSDAPLFSGDDVFAELAQVKTQHGVTFDEVKRYFDQDGVAYSDMQLDGENYLYILRKMDSTGWTLLFIIPSSYVAVNTLAMINTTIKLVIEAAIVLLVISIIIIAIIMHSYQKRVMEAEMRNSAELEATNRRLEEAKLATEQAYQSAQQANNAKTRFLNNMSHDIRTPMNAIVGFTSLASTHLHQTEVVKDYLAKIMAASEHLLSLINDVLDMSRIESGNVVINEKECGLPQIMHDLRNILQTDIKAKRMNFFIDTVDVEHETVICDRMRLNQILINCLSNSLKYTEPGGTVCLKLVEQDCTPDGFANYKFIVKDTGIGMTKEFAEHIFEPFTREEGNIAVNTTQGTGLGMAITKNIVDMMNGTITVNSELGKGTEFDITLKLKIVSTEKKPTVIKNLEGFRALVVDDSMDNCASTEKMLRVIGLRPDWTTSGKEAVYKARLAKENADPFQVYIIDWLIPDMNGIEVAKQIRREIGDQVPIIILTAYDWSDIEEEAKEAGVTAFCEKPLFMSELYDVLQRAGEDIEDKDRHIIAPQSFKGKRVLLVDDNELNREIAEAILRDAGLQVETAANGQLAVDRLNATRPGHYQLVLMDVMMPVMNGYEATREIRHSQREDIRKIPVIAMTANAFEEDREAAFAAGMTEHLTKPFKIEELVEVMSKFI